jgi:hypothetical protein
MVAEVHPTAWSGDFVLVFREIIGIGVSEMAILLAYAGKLSTAAINQLETMLRLPIALSGNLDIDGTLTSVAPGDEDFGGMHVGPHFIGRTDVTSKLFGTQPVRMPAIVGVDVATRRESIGFSESQECFDGGIDLRGIGFLEGFKSKLQLATREVGNRNWRRCDPLRTIHGFSRQAEGWDPHILPDSKMSHTSGPARHVAILLPANPVIGGRVFR